MSTDRATPDAVRQSQSSANRRLGWILLSVALVFGLGFMAKIALFGR